MCVNKFFFFCDRIGFSNYDDGNFGLGNIVNSVSYGEGVGVDVN